MGSKEKVSEEILIDSDSSHENEIILYNDDVNTFDHVIDTLMKVCDHTLEQAKQCSIIVHYKGKVAHATLRMYSPSLLGFFPIQS